jgi:UDP-N-acetyl-D-mannosaminuronate dehydrogenase
MNELEICISNLKQLIELARRINEPMLAYLLEMALAEADDKLKRRRTMN